MADQAVAEKDIDLATEPIAETENGCLVFGKLAEEWALDTLSEKAGGILEEGGYMGMEKSVGERVEKVLKGHLDAAPYITATEQILDMGIEDEASAKALYYCLRESIERYEGNAGTEHRRLLAARAAGEDQLAAESQEVAEENAAKALFAFRMYEAVEKFWIGLKDVAGAPVVGGYDADDFPGVWSDDPEIAAIEKEGVIALADVGRKYAVKLTSASEWRETFIKVGGMDSTKRIAELERRMADEKAVA